MRCQGWEHAVKDQKPRMLNIFMEANGLRVALLLAIKNAEVPFWLRITVG